MKNKLGILTALLTLCSVTGAHAVDYYFNAALVTEATTDPANLKYWFTDKDCTAQATSLPSFTNGKDNLYFVGIGENIAGNPQIVFSSDVFVNSISNTMSGTNMRYSPTITVANGGAIKTNTLTLNGYCSYVGAGVGLVEVYQDVILKGVLGAADKGVKGIGKFVVHGDLTVGSAGANFGKFYTTAASTLYNPNAIIKGVVTASTPRTGYDTQSLQYGSFNDQTINNNSYLWVNGFTGCAGVSISSDANSTGSFNVVLTNNSGEVTSSTGGLGVTYKDSSASTLKMKLIVMNAEYTYVQDSTTAPVITKYINGEQSFTGGTMSFKGGVDMISGALKLNYAATGADMNHGTLTLAKAGASEGIAAAEVALFGNSNETIGGTFCFSDIRVETSGTIRVRFEGKVFDAISLATGGISGTGTLVVDFDTTSVDDLAQLIISDASEAMKIISWGVGNTSTAEVIAAAGQESFTKDEVTYNFTSFVTDSGLAVGYVAVPEPAEYAAMFGALALAIAFYRRRK